MCYSDSTVTHSPWATAEFSTTTAPADRTTSPALKQATTVLGSF